MKLSVIVCTYNRADQLRRTLESLAGMRVAPALSWELLVIDNNSTDSTPEVSRQFQKRLPIQYFFERRQGLSAARNRGIREARGELLVFTDDDVDVDANWVNALCAGAEQGSAAFFFGGPIQTRWEAPPPAPLARHATGCLSGLAVYYVRTARNPYLEAGETSFIGANMMFRKSVFEAGFRFRENLGRKGTDLTGHEDTVLMRELVRAGYRGYYIADAMVFHRTSPERMTERYLRQWHIGAGRGVVQLDPGSPDQPRLADAPRYLWRKLVAATLRFAVSRWTCRSAVWVPAECEMALTWGQILEHRKLSRGPERVGREGAHSIPLWLRVGHAGAWPLRLIRRAGKSPRRVLIMLWGSLGDTLLSTGAVRRLIRHFQPNPVDLLVSENSCSLVCTLPGVQRIWTMDFGRLGDISLRGRLQRLGLAFGLSGNIYEQVVILGPVPTDFILAFPAILRPKEIWHFAESPADSAASKTQASGETPGPSFPLTHQIPWHPFEPELDDLARFLGEMGVPASEPAPLTRAGILPEILFTAEDQKQVDDVLWRHSAGEPADWFRLALCPGARFKQKDWGLDKYLALLDELKHPARRDALFGGRRLEVVMLGGPEDRDRFQALTRPVVQDASVRLWSVMGELNPRQAILFLRTCQACLGNDTFGLHAAIVAGIPSVVIMGGGDYGRWLPWLQPAKHRMVSGHLPCFGCHWRCSRATFDCVERISVADVVRELTLALTESP